MRRSEIHISNTSSIILQVKIKISEIFFLQIYDFSHAQEYASLVTKTILKFAPHFTPHKMR
jgi:hypothetical protein